MKLFIAFCFLFIISTKQSVSQTDQFTRFIIENPRKDCLTQLDSISIQELFQSKILRIRNHNVTLVEVKDNTLTIDPFGLCNEYQTISYHLYSEGDRQFMFVYKKYATTRQAYGELQLFEEIDGQWKFGRLLILDWNNFFSISEKEIKRLHDLNQYPKYLIRFTARGIEFSIPWEIYSFDQGSEVNGYVQGNGSQPILLEYSELIR